MDNNNADDAASARPIIDYNEYLLSRAPLKWSQLALPPGSIVHKSRPKEIDIDKPTHGHILQRMDEPIMEDNVEQSPLDDLLQTIYKDVEEKTSERCPSSSSEQAMSQQTSEIVESVGEQLSKINFKADGKSRSISGASTSSSTEGQYFEVPKKYDYPSSNCSATAYRKSNQTSESQPSSKKGSKSKKKKNNEKRKKLELQPFLESLQADAARNYKDEFLESVQLRKREREAEQMAKLQNEQNTILASKLSHKSDPQNDSECGVGFWEDASPQPKIQQSQNVVEVSVKPLTETNVIIMENISVDNVDDDIEGCMSGYGIVKSLSSQVYGQVKTVELVLESDVDIDSIISWMYTMFEGPSGVNIYCKN